MSWFEAVTSYDMHASLHIWTHAKLCQFSLHQKTQDISPLISTGLLQKSKSILQKGGDFCRFVERFDQLLERVKSRQGGPKPTTVVVVGGGAGGAEIAFAVHHRFCVALGHPKKQPVSPSSNPKSQTAAPFVVKLVTKATILPSHPPRARWLVLSAAEAEGIEILEHSEVKSISPQGLILERGGVVGFDECLWCTQAIPAPWLSSTGLPKGVLAIRTTASNRVQPTASFSHTTF